MAIDIKAQFALIRDACVQLRGPDYCTDTVVQVVGALARHESGFSEYKPFFRPATADTPAWHAWNFGAQQCGKVADKNGQCPPGCFPAKDTSPTASGASVAYQACFIVNDSPAAGARSLVKLVAVDRPLIAAALPSGDLQLIAEQMHASKYFEGFGKTVEIRIRNYGIALDRNGALNAKQAGVPYLLVLPPLPAPAPSASAAPSSSAAGGAPIAVLVDSTPEGPQPTGDGATATGVILLLAAAISRWLRRGQGSSEP